MNSCNFVSPNRVCGCDVYAYDGPNYSGRQLLIRQQNARFNNDFFNDRVESLKIHGKCTYLFYENDNFLGNVFIKTPGYYASLANFGNSISSARALPPQGTNAILLFEHINYAGRMVALYSSQQDLPFLDYNDHISSVIVTGGSWTLYDHSNYHGSYQTIGVGYYPQPPVGNDRISSIRNN